MPDPVAAYLDALDPAARAMVDALRGVVIAAGPALSERIKWNAPSFAIGDEDRITLGLERKGGVRMVLHRGARASTPAGFVFEDPDRLAKWPAPDRGVLQFSDLAAIEAQRRALIDLCRRWLAATR